MLYLKLLTLHNKITIKKNGLHSKTSFIDYVHVIVKFLVSNDKKISKIRKNQGKKIHNLFLKNSYHNSVTSHDPDKAIFHFSSHVHEARISSLMEFKQGFFKSDIQFLIFF